MMVDNPRQPPVGAKLYYEPGADHLVVETDSPHDFTVMPLETFPDIDPKLLPISPIGPD